MQIGFVVLRRTRGEIGFDYGSTFMRAAHVVPTKDGSYSVERTVYVRTPPGAVKKGEIVDVAAFTQALTQLWEDGGFGSKTVVPTVGGPRVPLRRLDVDRLAPAAMLKAFPYLAKEKVPSLNIEETTMAYYPIAEWNDDKISEDGTPVTAPDGSVLVAPKAQVMVVSAGKDTLNPLEQAINGAGLRMNRVDAFPYSLIRARIEKKDPQCGVEVIVHAGAEYTLFLMHRGGVPLRSQWIMDWGSHMIDRALAEHFNTTMDQAEAAKVRIGLGDQTRLPDASTADQEQLSIIGSKVSALIQSVEKNIKFAKENDPGMAGIDSIVLTGGGSRLRGIHQRMAATLQQSVTPLSLAGHIDATGSDIADIDYTAAIGAAVRAAS